MDINIIRRLVYRNSQLLRKNKTGLIKFLIPFEKMDNKEIEYNGIIYSFMQIRDMNYIVLYNDMIIIVINDMIAEVHQYDMNQLHKMPLLDTNTNITPELLELTIMFLKKYKYEYNIMKIVLDDNNIIKENDNYIALSDLMILLTGDTFYGRYGFVRYFIYDDIIESVDSEIYSRNKMIMDTKMLKNKNCLLKRYIEKIMNL
jgi:hypothetical protein